MLGRLVLCDEVDKHLLGIPVEQRREVWDGRVSGIEDGATWLAED